METRSDLVDQSPARLDDTRAGHDQRPGCVREEESEANASAGDEVE